MSDITTYLKPEFLAESIGIVDLKESKYKSKIEELVIEANQELDMQLKPFAGQLPLDTGSTLYGQIRKVALHYALKVWHHFFGQIEQARMEGEDYEKKLEALKATFNADKTDRTETILVNHDPRNDNILLPSQVDTAVFDF